MRRLALILLIAALTPLESAAAEPRIRDLVATEEHGSISVSFRLEGAFDDPEIGRALQSGLPTVITYDLVLIRKRPNWFDDTITSSKIEVVATYNSLTREYLLNYRRDRRLVSSGTFSSIDELKRAMANIREPDAFGTAGRKPYKLRVRVRADLLRRYVWYIIPWDVATPWEDTRVRSVGKPR
ncbi:MAG TPA: DUF4390 domain-containing protein [Thermoanaerobaculia bacterium]|nr:DUF4390 domain-containing protein [Thermoanaerobaculia bacterium]